MLEGGLSVNRRTRSAPEVSPPKAPSPTSECNSGPPTPWRQAPWCSEPRMRKARTPWPNSSARAPGTAIMARARAGSTPSNHGSPIPMGSPDTMRSTREPMLSRSERVASTRARIAEAASASWQRRSRSAKDAPCTGSGASTSPIAPTCAVIRTPIPSSNGLMIAAAATSGAVRRADEEPPPRRSACPLLRSVIGRS